MKLEAIVNPQGILTAKLPKSLWGKKVMISMQAVPETLAQAGDIFDIFAEADKLNFPRRSHAEILEDLRTLRASE